MGLDMYVLSLSKEELPNPEQQTDITIPKGAVSQDWYWRKFNALHGWMHKLYLDKGGQNAEFNGDTVQLTLWDIDQLEQDMKDNKLTPTEGFFFGAMKIYPEDLESLKEFLSEARDILKEDTHVLVYDSSW